jgi:hypothetical protein
MDYVALPFGSPEMRGNIEISTSTVIECTLSIRLQRHRKRVISSSSWAEEER